MKGVPADVRKARHEGDQCVRCGKSGHMWFQCTNRIIVSAAGGKKRKAEGDGSAGAAPAANTEKETPTPTTKKARVTAAMGAQGRRLAQRVRTPVSGVFELESGEED